MTCNRVAVYVGYDRFNKRRTGQVPVPDGVTPQQTVIKNGVRMELSSVSSREDPVNALALDTLAEVQRRREA